MPWPLFQPARTLHRWSLWLFTPFSDDMTGRENQKKIMENTRSIDLAIVWCWVVHKLSDTPYSKRLNMYGINIVTLNCLRSLFFGGWGGEWWRKKEHIMINHVIDYIVDATFEVGMGVAKKWRPLFCLFWTTYGSLWQKISLWGKLERMAPGWWFTNVFITCSSFRRNPIPDLNSTMVGNYTTPETNMTMEKQQFEDVSSVKTGDFPLTC